MKLVSTGINCEVAQQIGAFQGEKASGFFNWLVTPIDSLIEIIGNDFKNCFRLEDLIWDDMQNGVHNKASGITFHHLFPKDEDGRTSAATVALHYEQALSKVNYLTEKWKDELNLDEVCYIRRCNSSSIDIDRLYDALAKARGNENFRLVWAIRPSDKVEQPKNVVEIVTVAAPSPGPEAWKGSEEAWRPVLQRLSGRS